MCVFCVYVQEIKDQLGATLTDTLLAMTIFRGDFDAQFGKLLVCLIFLKFFHWTARLRVDYIAQTISFSRQCRYCFFLWCIFFFGIENSFFDLFSFHSIASFVGVGGCVVVGRSGFCVAFGAVGAGVGRRRHRVVWL